MDERHVAERGAPHVQKTLVFGLVLAMLCSRRSDLEALIDRIGERACVLGKVGT